MTRTFIHTVILVVLLCNAQTNYSQQLSFVSGSHYNLFEENIAFAGNYKATHLTTHFSKVWSVNGAPTQYSFSAHSPIQEKKLGVGLRIGQVDIGAHKESSAKLALSYKLGLGNGLLSFGLGTGISIYNFDVSQLNAAESEDFLLSQSNVQNHFLDVDVAAMYTTKKLFFGLEISQLTKSSWQIHEDDNSAQVMHYKIIGGKVFKLKNNDLIRVSGHVRSDINIQPQVDLMANYFLKEIAWIGLGYRLNFGLLAKLEINVTRRFQFGYSYASNLSPMANPFSNIHQVFLGYMLPNSSKKAPKIRSF